MSVTLGALTLANGLVSLLTENLRRISPSQLKELEKLDKERLTLEKHFGSYMQMPPSGRIQTVVEDIIKRHGEVINEIDSMRIYAEAKLKLMAVNGDSSNNS